MGASLIGALIGFVAGAGSGTAGGAILGAFLGMLAGAMVHGLWWAWAHSGDQPVVETHRVMCTPLGQLADIAFVGDRDRGRWTDVRRCSLLPTVKDVECDKRCLRRMNETGVRPGEPCRCGAEHG